MKPTTVEDLRVAKEEEIRAMSGCAQAVRELSPPLAAMVLCNVLVSLMRALGVKRKVFREMCMRTWDGAEDLATSGVQIGKAGES